jgi:hypothetical protein
MRSPDLFSQALAQDRMKIVALDSSHQVVWTSEDSKDIEVAIKRRDLLPIKPLVPLLVMSNIVAEAFTYVFGFLTGNAGAIIAHAKGIKNLSPDNADSIMRRLKKGTVGLILIVLGYFLGR